MQNTAKQNYPGFEHSARNDVDILQTTTLPEPTWGEKLKISFGHYFAKENFCLG